MTDRKGREGDRERSFYRLALQMPTTAGAVVGQDQVPRLPMASHKDRRYTNI